MLRTHIKILQIKENAPSCIVMNKKEGASCITTHLHLNEILFQTLIKFTYQLFFIKMSPDKNYFLHTISIFIIPIPQ